MTGRRIYELYCDAVRSEASRWDSDAGAYVPRRGFVLKAWPFLTDGERQTWAAMASRVKGVRR